MWTVFAWIAAAAISAVSLRYFSIPYMWIFLACAIALFATAAIDRQRRAVWFNVACISVGLAIFEYYLWTSSTRAYADARVKEGNSEEELYAYNEELGWAPRAETVVNEKVSFKGETIYDAVYKIGPNLLRISSPLDRHDPSTQCIFFFGGSFTFGQGLEDHETLPYQVHAQSAQRYRTYNFGVPGYGAHQVLSALQHGLVQDVVQCDPPRVSQVFYQSITDHISRAAGRLWWEQYGPKYVLAENGGVRLDGRFENDDDYHEERALIDMFGTQIFKSMIYQAIIQGRYVHRYSSDVRDLYLAIIEEARSRVLADYPAAQFHVLLWDEDNADNRAIREGLTQRGISVHLMSDILPNYRADDLNDAYRIHERDAHPNALANELIARYLLREVLP